MSWFFGAGMGMLFGGPLGAIAGGVLEHMVTKGAQNVMKDGQAQRTNDQEAVFITNLAAIMTKVAMADGQISSRERKIIHNFFETRLGYSGEELRYIDGIIAETGRVNPDLIEICQTFRIFAPMEIRLLLLDMTYQIASADNVITQKERLEIDIIAVQIGVSAADHNRIKYKYQTYSRQKEDTFHENNFYKVLGVSKKASNEEIKQAYKQMAMQYHPDKVSHLGEELIEFANKKFKEINEAYNAIRKERRI